MANWKTINGKHVDLDKQTLNSIRNAANNVNASDKTLDNAYKKAKTLQKNLQRQLKENEKYLTDTQKDALKTDIQELEQLMKRLKDRWDED